MEIRGLTVASYDQIIALWRRAGLPYKSRGRDRKESVQTEIRAHPDFFIGAFDDEALIGVVVVSCDGRKGWINRLAVDPAHRRKGIAQALINEAEKVLRKHGIKIYCALIEDHNIGSMQLFEKCGYTVHRDVLYFSKRDNDLI